MALVGLAAGVLAQGALLLRPRRAEAHDVALTSIARLFLDQLAEHRYLLSVLDTNVPSIAAGGIVLPRGCDAEGAGDGGSDAKDGTRAGEGAGARGARSPAPAPVTARPGSTVAFDCDRPLAFDDLITLRWPLSGVVVVARWGDGSGGSAYFRGNGRTIPVRLADLRAGAGSVRRLAARYFVLGCEHILFGVDHLLFVTGLLLLVHSLGELVRTVTAFTVAHSITLAAAVFGWIPVDRAPVEAAIALSIVLLAREIVMGHRGRVHLVHRWPWLVAFMFGLLHGLGFAGALGAIGLRANDIPLALLFFNLGVETGQLSFVSVLVAAGYVAKRRPGRAAAVTRLQPALGYVLGTLSMVWLFQRLPAVFGG